MDELYVDLRGMRGWDDTVRLRDNQKKYTPKVQMYVQYTM